MRLFATFLLVAIGLVTAISAASAERHAADLFPATTVFYAEMARPKELLHVILEHPLRARIEAFEGYQRALSKQEYRERRAVLSAIEAQLGMTWQEAVGVLAEGGIHAGFDAETQGVAALMRFSSAQTVIKTRQVLLQWIRNRAGDKEPGQAHGTDTYREVGLDRIGDAVIAVIGPWLLISNKQQLVERLVDRHLDGGTNTLGQSDSFKAARDGLAVPPAIWLFADVRALRDAGVARELFQGRADNPLLEILIGGLLSTVQKTPYVTASFVIERSQARLGLSMPYDFSWIPESRHYYFGQQGRAVASPLIVPDNSLFAVSTYRDVSGMWLHAGDLFDEGMNDELAKVDSNLSTLFAGKDFGEDILGALQPQLSIIAVRQEFGEQLPRPALKLPAFAMVLRLKDPKTMQNELRRTFQSLVGFFNVVGAMNGQPQLDLESEKGSGYQIISSTYVPEPDEQESDQARVNFNFSPTVAFIDDRFIVASTKQLARALTNMLQGEGRSGSGGDANTAVRLDFGALREILAHNRSQLVAQNMLKEGNSNEQAEKEIDLLLSIVGMFRDASLRLMTDERSLKIALELNAAAEQ